MRWTLVASFKGLFHQYSKKLELAGSISHKEITIICPVNSDIPIA